MTEVKTFNIPEKLLLNYSNLDIDEIEFVVLLLIIYYVKKKTNNILDELEKNMSLTKPHIMPIIARLIEKRIIDIDDTQEISIFRLEPLWEKLNTLDEPEIFEDKLSKRDIVRQFEKSFGRFLSPIETNKINEWMNNHPLPLILEALERAVMQNKMSLSYINTILENWKNNNIKSLEAVRANDERFEKRKNKNNISNKMRNSKDLWSENDDKFSDIYIT